ncbi:hypothetical protein EGJ05_19405 [Stutzerimonas xanthomarina]|nr:hypothetical protein EGJ05_19405 [Stutzerimonas xanthomarina]
MEQKFNVSLTGNLLNGTMEDVIEDLSTFIQVKNKREIEHLITSKATIKKGTNLTLANKIKSRVEQAGAECLIEIDIQEPQITQQLPTPEPEQAAVAAPAIGKAPLPSSNHQKEGTILIAIAIITMIASIILSDGYEPRLGLLWSLNEQMTILSGYPFGCKDVVYTGGVPGSYALEDLRKASGGCAESFYFVLRTKYLLMFSCLILAYGVGQYLGHFKSLSHYWAKVCKS